jgi:hypothetical protein
LVLCTKERVIESNRRNRIDCLWRGKETYLSVSLVHWINQMHQIRPRVQPFI